MSQEARHVLQYEALQGVRVVARSKTPNKIDDAPEDLGVRVVAFKAQALRGPWGARRASQLKIFGGEFLKQDFEQVARAAILVMRRCVAQSAP